MRLRDRVLLRVLESRPFLWARKLLAKRYMSTRTEDDAWTEVDRIENETREVINNFLAAHPELDPKLFGIPEEKYDRLAFYAATDAVTSMLWRYDRVSERETAGWFLLHEDGEVTSLLDEPLIPASTTQAEVSSFIYRHYQWDPNDLTRDFNEAHRREKEHLTGASLEHARAFLRWMMAALHAQPELTKDFRVWHPADGQKHLMFEPLWDDSDDPLAGWR